MESQEIGLSSICFGRDTLPPPLHSHYTLPQYLHSPPHSPLSLLHPCSHPITKACRKNPCFYMSSKVSPCGAEKRRQHVSRVLNKALLHNTRDPQSLPLMGRSNMLRSSTDGERSISTIAVLLNLSHADLSFVPGRRSEARWMEERDGRSKDGGRYELWVFFLY